MLEGYLQKYPPADDLAWGHLYPELCAWLSDRDHMKAKKARERSDDPTEFHRG